MAKVLTGVVVSTGMNGVVVVEVTRKTPHPLYKKLMKRSKKFKAATQGKTLTIGETVQIKESRPISKDTHFVIHQEEKKAKGGKK
jgi:small subunit ribosomal protein S17